jgi:hypothetical protein
VRFGDTSNQDVALDSRPQTTFNEEGHKTHGRRQEETLENTVLTMEKKSTVAIENIPFHFSLSAPKAGFIVVSPHRRGWPRKGLRGTRIISI